MSFPRYPAYKPSGVEWLGEVPDDWEALRLRFVATLNPSKQEAREVGDQEVVSFLPMEAIGEDGSLRLEQEKEVGECLAGYTYFRDEDVCIAKITPCFENSKGTILRELKGGIGFATTELIVARPHKEKITSEFLDYLFRSQTFRRLGESEMYGAGGQKRVPDSFVRDFTAALPSIGEQRQVASFLDRETAKIDALIAEQQRLIELLQEKRQAVISQAVTKGLNPNAPMKDSGVEWLGEVPEHWEVKPLKRLATVQTGMAKGKDLEGVETTEVPYLRVANVQDGYLDLEEVYQLTVPIASIDRYLLKKGDVLMNEGGDFDKLGRGCMWAGDIEPCVHQNHVFAVRPHSVSGQWLNTYTSSKEANSYFISRSKQSTNLASISSTNLMGLLVPVPPGEEASEMLGVMNERVQEIDGLKLSATQAVDLLQDRRSALISAAVTGQIDVRGLM